MLLGVVICLAGMSYYVLKLLMITPDYTKVYPLVSLRITDYFDAASPNSSKGTQLLTRI